MLFLSDAVLESRRQLFADHENGKLDAEQMYRKALELDPDDYIALGALARIRAEAGDSSAAEDLLWRSIQAQPCDWSPYLTLSGLLKGQPLAFGLAELAFGKVPLDPEGLEELDSEMPSIAGLGVGIKELEGLGVGKLEALVHGLHKMRDDEPVAVTARLQSLRLVHELQVGEDVEPELVDALVQEGEAIVPLLIGVLRGWAQDVLPEEDVPTIENTMAIIGEIGDTSGIPALLEMITIDNANVSRPGEWAFDRIVEQNPERAVQVLAEVAPKLDTQERIAAATSLLKFPPSAVTMDVFEKLLENFSLLETEDRGVCFELVTSSAIMILGRPGIEFARRMLRQHGGLLSRNSRRQADDLIQEFSLIAIPPRPPLEPSQWTVYDICAGNVDWEEEQPESDEDEDDYLPPEPSRKPVMPGRNDPCWCGSGKKYKKCHLESDEEAERKAAEPRARDSQGSGSEFDALRGRIGNFRSKLMTEQDTIDAISEFFGTDELKEENDPMMLIDWLIHDRISPSSGRTVMEEYLKRNATSLTPREREFVESSARSYMDLFEVQNVTEGTGIEVKSLTSGETFFVHEIGLSKIVSRWDGLYGRVVNGERGLEFTGLGTRVPRTHLDAVRQRLEEEKRRSGLSWPAYLKRNWPSVNAQHREILASWVEALRLNNGDGDELVISTASYRVLDEDALPSALRASPELYEEEKGASFVWLSAPKDGTVLGTLRIADSQLKLECNSRERLQRGKRLVAGLAGSAVQFDKEEFTTQAEMKRDIRENPTPRQPEKDDIPPDVKRELERQHMEEYYANWLDMKIPALDGKTPRQAARNAAGKRKVAELLKQLENMESHKLKAGEYAYDVSKLRRELGIKG